MRNEKGVALVGAIMLTLFVSSTAALLLWRADRGLQRLGGEYALAQARALAIPALTIAATTLVEAGGTAGEEPPLPLPPDALPKGVSITSTVVDAQGGLNVNMLAFGGVANDAVVATLRRLLAITGDDPAYAEAFADWIDADESPRRFGGAESDAYPRWSVANGLVATAEEGLLIPGADPQLFAGERPLLVALPKPTPVNVNAARPELLMALFGGLHPDEAIELAKELAAHPASTMEELITNNPRLNVTAPSSLVGFTSHFFIIRAVISIERRRFRFDALYEFGDRDTAPRRVWVRSI